MVGVSDPGGLISVHSCNFSSASLSCRFGSPLAPLLPVGMCTGLTRQRASGAFGSGNFAVVPMFFMKQHQDQWLSLPGFPCWRLRRQESGLSEPNPGRHLGLTKPETRRAEKWEECTVAISPCFLRLTSVLNCFHVFCSTVLLIDTCNSTIHLFKYLSRVY